MQAMIASAAKDVLQKLVLRGRFVWRLPPRSLVAALTFDDGPHPIYTPAMLDVLAGAGVRATFFVVGERVEQHPELARRIVAEGHGIAGHGYDHRVITSLSRDDLVEDLWRCRRAIAAATGADTALFRPPKGVVSLRAMRTVAAAGFTLVHWTRTYSDYRQDGVPALLARLQRAQPKAGDVLLFHDHNRFTVEVLRRQLPLWRSSGLDFDVLEAGRRATSAVPTAQS